MGLSGFLRSRHNMKSRSMYAKQIEEDGQSLAGIANNP